MVTHRPPRVIPCTRPVEKINVIPRDETTRIIGAWCGHDSPQFFRFKVGDTLVPEPEGYTPSPLFPNWRWHMRFVKRWKCTDCQTRAWLDACIICPCGKLIAPRRIVGSCGMPHGDTPQLPFLQFATRWTEAPDTVVTCSACTPAGLHSGVWTGEAIESPFATGIQAGDAIADGIAIMVVVGAGHAGRIPKGGIIST